MKRKLLILSVFLFFLNNCSTNKNKQQTEQLGEPIDSILVNYYLSTHGLMDSLEFSIVSKSIIKKNIPNFIWTPNTDDELRNFVAKKSHIQWILYYKMLSDYENSTGHRLDNEDFSLETLMGIFSDEHLRTMANRNRRLDAIFVNTMVEEYGDINFLKFDSLAQVFNTNVIIESFEKSPVFREIYDGNLPTRTEIERDFFEQINTYKAWQWNQYRKIIKYLEEANEDSVS